MYPQLVAICIAVGLSGCSFGIGPTSAANRQAPDGYMVGYRLVNTRTGVTESYGSEWWDQWKSPFGLHGGVRKGWWKGGIQGRPATGGDLTEMHFDLTFALGAFAATATYIGYAWNNTKYSDGPNFEHEASGPGLGFSYAIFPFISLDAMYARLGGPLKFGAGTTQMESEMGANRISIGTTITGLPIVGVKLDLNRVGGVVNYLGQDMTWGAWGFSVEGIISLF